MNACDASEWRDLLAAAGASAALAGAVAVLPVTGGGRCWIAVAIVGAVART
ncbi:MAG: hypothetical protein R2725_12095 [Solirubrobacterales bacterium]